MQKKNILLGIILIGLMFWQSSVSSINWLILAVLWLALEKRWLEIFLLGLSWDLISGRQLGLGSIAFLLSGLLAYGYSQRLSQWQWLFWLIIIGVSDILTAFILGDWQWQNSLWLIAGASFGWLALGFLKSRQREQLRLNI